jgi:nucleotide-binding universal stress UspA family protein
MKSILIPVDFSDCSFSASKYAVEIAKITNAKLVFFHSYFLPVSGQEIYLSPEIIEEQEKTVLTKLMNFSTKVIQSVKESSTLVCLHVTMPGFLTNYISDLISEYSVDMIVMGTTGKSGILSKIFIGSNANNVVQLSSIPVLVVPEKAVFKPFQKIVFATTLQEIKDLNIIYPLMELSWWTKFEIHFIVVVPDEKTIPTEEQLKEYMALDSVFKHIPHFLEVTEDKNIIHALESYVQNIEADLLVTIPHKHGLADKIFQKSITSEMVFHAYLPILCLKPDAKDAV